MSYPGWRNISWTFFGLNNGILDSEKTCKNRLYKQPALVRCFAGIKPRVKQSPHCVCSDDAVTAGIFYNCSWPVRFCPLICDSSSVVWNPFVYSRATLWSSETRQQSRTGGGRQVETSHLRHVCAVKESSVSAKSRTSKPRRKREWERFRRKITKKKMFLHEAKL